MTGELRVNTICFHVFLNKQSNVYEWHSGIEWHSGTLFPTIWVTEGKASDFTFTVTVDLSGGFIMHRSTQNYCVSCWFVCLFGLWVLLKDTPNLQYIVGWYVTPHLASAELQLPSWAGNNSVSLAIRFPGIDARTSKLVMLGRTSALGFWKWETLIITDSGGQENGCRWPVPFLVLLLHVL